MQILASLTGPPTLLGRFLSSSAFLGATLLFELLASELLLVLLGPTRGLGVCLLLV